LMPFRAGAENVFLARRNKRILPPIWKHAALFRLSYSRLQFRFIYTLNARFYIIFDFADVIYFVFGHFILSPLIWFISFDSKYYPASFTDYSQKWLGRFTLLTTLAFLATSSLLSRRILIDCKVADYRCTAFQHLRPDLFWFSRFVVHDRSITPRRAEWRSHNVTGHVLQVTIPRNDILWFIDIIFLMFALWHIFIYAHYQCSQYSLPRSLVQNKYVMHKAGWSFAFLKYCTYSQVYRLPYAAHVSHTDITSNNTAISLTL
jgi:hypothetical protein